MILLDTNVLSEGLRPRPDPGVRAWLDAQRATDLFLCVPVLAELRYGIELLTVGARRAGLEIALEKMEQGFGERILSFDREAAHQYGRIVAHRDRMGRPIGTMDAVIAAIARVHGATLATRDRRGFEDIGLDVIDPFDPSVI